MNGTSDVAVVASGRDEEHLLPLARDRVVREHRRDHGDVWEVGSASLRERVGMEGG